MAYRRRKKILDKRNRSYSSRWGTIKRRDKPRESYDRSNYQQLTKTQFNAKLATQGI